MQKKQKKPLYNFEEEEEKRKEVMEAKEVQKL